MLAAIVFNGMRPHYPIIFLLVLLAYFIYKAAGAPVSDYAGYYFGSRALLQGNFQQVYDTYSLNALIAQQGYTGVFVSYTPFPPFTSVVLAPFLVFPVAVSKIIFNIVSASLFVIVLGRTVKHFSIPQWIGWLIPVLFFIPFRNNIYFGQAYLLLFALLMEGFMAYKKGRTITAALLWAGAIVFKLFPLVLLFFLLVKKQYKQLAYCVAACMLLGVVSLLFNGFASWQYYVFTIFPRANSGELNNSYTFLFQSAFMLLKNLFVYDEVQNPQVFFNNMPLFIICIVLFKSLILACCVGISLHKATTDQLAFAGWITASLLLSPNGSSYSLVLLLLPLLTLANSRQVYMYIFMALVFSINSIPVQALTKWPLLLQYPRLYLLLLFFLLLVIGTGARLHWRPLLAFFMVLLLGDMPKLFAKQDNSSYLLKEKLPLVYAYATKDKRLVYYYWDEKGGHEKMTAYPVLQESAADVQIKNNQVYYKNNRLTSTPDRKRQALMINGNEIIYLSDKNRGFGFYTLRRITVP